MVEVVQGKPKRRYSTLINPETIIPRWITRLTGITNAMVARAPRFEQVVSDVESWMADGLFVAHCAQFDYGFMREAYHRVGRTFDRPYLCTRTLARRVMPGLTSYGLTAVTRHVGLRIRNRHRALGDAAATARLLRELLQRAEGTSIDVAGLLRHPEHATRDT